MLIRFGLIALFGVGLFVIVYALLSSFADAFSNKLTNRRQRLMELVRGRSISTEPAKVIPDDLLGLGKVPWGTILIVSLVASLGLNLVTQQLIVLLFGLAPFAIRTWLVNQRKRQVGADVLAFLTDLRLAMPLQGSLLRALQDVASRGGSRLADITARYLRGGFNGNGIELLELLATNIKAPYLNDLIAWTKAAEEGTMKSDAPFEHAMTRLHAEMYTAARENLQNIPTRLTIFVMPALFGPAIIMILYPVVARLLASLSGMGFAGGF